MMFSPLLQRNYIVLETHKIFSKERIKLAYNKKKIVQKEKEKYSNLLKHTKK